MSKHESESAPRVTTRRTTVFRLDIQISGLFDEATLRWLRNVLPFAHTRARGSVLSHSIGAASGRSKLRPSRRERDKARPDAATGPAAVCPPVCQRTTFPLRRNVRIIPYRADGRKMCEKENASGRDGK